MQKDSIAQQEIKKVIEKEIFKYLPKIFKSPQQMFIQYYKEVVAIKWGSNGNEEFLKIRGGYNDHKAVVYFFDETTHVESFGFKNDTQYEKWVKDFMKK